MPRVAHWGGGSPPLTWLHAAAVLPLVGGMQPALCTRCRGVMGGFWGLIAAAQLLDWRRRLWEADVAEGGKGQGAEAVREEKRGQPVGAVKCGAV